MKLAPLHRAFAVEDKVEHVVVHTGQHYDPVMSDAFFHALDIPEPHYNLGVGSASHAQQTAAVIQGLEPVFLSHHPDLVLVYGDVNSTVAAALVASKMGIRLGHVEAGLRSGDWSMPEEINRVVTDRLSNLLFTPSRDADENLRAEGVPTERIALVGNVMIDSLVHALPSATELCSAERFALRPREYILVTLHRPSNVDDPKVFSDIMSALGEISKTLPVLFPVHPRTRQRIVDDGIIVPQIDSLQLIEPLGYLEMLSLVATARLVITDSGGLQEETSHLQVPCLTVRENTERPVTVTHGTNRLVASDNEALVTAASGIMNNPPERKGPIELWDGKAALRIAAIVVDRHG